MYVRDLMSPQVISVRPGDSLALARQVLRDNHIHHLVVLDRDRLVGVLSYRDLIGAGDADAVVDVMSRDIVTVQPDETVRKAASLILGHSHGCLAVLDGGVVKGVITTTDLLHAVSSRKEGQA